MAKFMLKYRKIEYTIEEAESIRVGRSPESRIVIDDPRVSENHCEINWDPDKGATIRDLGSLNGTIVLRGKKKILVGMRPDSVKREEAYSVVSDYFLLYSGDRIRLFSECIIDVEYSINSTRAEGRLLFDNANADNSGLPLPDRCDSPVAENVCPKGDKAYKIKKTINAEKIRKSARDNCKIGEPIKDEDQNRENKPEYNKEEDANFNKAQESLKEKEVGQENILVKEDNMTERDSEAKAELSVIKLDATVKESLSEDYEIEWGNSLISKFLEEYNMDYLYLGGFVELYVATPLKWDKEAETIVIKILTLSNDAKSETAELLFEREKKIAPQLHHPNIIKTYKAGRSGNQQYIMMEYCKYGNLADFVSDKGLHRLPEKMAIKIIVQVLKGLNYFHYPPFRIEYDDKYRRALKDGAKQLVHRDIKPMNLLVRSVNQNGDPEIVICDFGLAKDSAIGGSTGITTGPNEVRATLAFAPCEQIQAPALVNPGVDIWSTFAVLFWLLTGETPRAMDGCSFDQIEDTWQLKSVKKFFESNHVRKIHSIRSDVSPELAELIDAVLSTDQSVHEYSKEEELDLIHKLEGML